MTTGENVQAPIPQSVPTECTQCPLYDHTSPKRRLELLSGYSSDVICDIRDGIITYLSPNAMAVSGLRPETVVGRSLLDLLHPDDVPTFARYAVSGWTGPIEAVFRVADSSGAWRWKEARGLRLRDEDGSHYSVLILRDITRRRQAEEALERSEARATAFLRAIPDLMFRVSRDGRYIDFKAERAEDLYVAPDALIGSFVADVLPAELASRAMDTIARALDDGGVHTLEYALVKRGEPRDYEARFVASGDNEVVVIARDITERRESERVLRESEEKYRSLIERSRDMIYTRDLDGKVTSANAMALQVYGYTEDEMRGLNFADLVDPAYLPLARANMERAFRGETMLAPLEFLSYAKDGTPRWVERVGDPIIANGEITGFQVSLRDISQRKETEAQLVLQSQLLDMVHQSIIVTDRSGAITLVNRYTPTLFGYDGAELTGMIALGLIAPPSHRTARAAMRSALDGADWAGEILVQRKDGTSFPALGHVTPILDEGGAVTGAVIVTADLSAVKRAEENAQAANEHATVLRERARIAQELHDSVAQFFFGIGIAAKELSERKSVAPTALRRRLSHVRRLATDGGREIRNAIEALSARALADDLAAELAHLCDAFETSSGLRVTCAGALSVPLAPGRAYDLYAAAREALYNVLKHARATTATVTLRDDGADAVVEIADDGSGKPAAVLRAIAGGRGFGLKSVSARLAAHGGRLEITDNEPRGLTVRLVVPVLAEVR